MKLIIAGSRGITELETVKTAFNESEFSWDEVDLLVSGKADGVDSLGEELAKEHDIPIDPYPVEDFLDEAPHPKAAPVMRNTEMAEQADALLAVWDGESPGTEDMITKAQREEIRVHIYRTDTHGLSDFV